MIIAYAGSANGYIVAVIILQFQVIQLFSSYNLLHQFQSSCSCFDLRAVLMLQNDGGDLLADGDDGVQAGHGILENGGDLLAADLCPVVVILYLGKVEHALTMEAVGGLVQILHPEGDLIEHIAHNSIVVQILAAPESEAFLFHSARAFDQGGPLRIGPTFPFVLPGDPWPLPPYPQYEWYEGKRYGNGWKYLASSYGIPKDQIPGRLVTTGRELELWRKGNDRLAAALPHVPAVKRPSAKRMLGLGRFFEHTVRTVRNGILFKRDGLVLTDAKSSAADRAAAAKRLLAVIGDEESNVRETIPFVEADSSLGWEPSMFYVADREHLEWKLRQLDGVREKILAR